MNIKSKFKTKQQILSLFKKKLLKRIKKNYKLKHFLQITRQDFMKCSHREKVYYRLAVHVYAVWQAVERVHTPLVRFWAPTRLQALQNMHCTA